MKILIFFNNYLGDIILSTGTYSYFVDKYPDCKITIVCPTKFHSLFQEAPNLERMISFDKKNKDKKRFYVWKNCLFNYWDIVFDIKNSYYTKLLFYKKYKAWNGKKIKDIHRVDGINNCFSLPIGTKPKVWINEKKAFDYKLEFEKKGRRTLSISPMSSWQGKIWPYYKDFIKKFQENYPEDHILLICAPNEKEDMKKLIKNCDVTKITCCDNEENISNVAAQISACDLFLGNDSGPMHLSSSVGTNTIGLFGPSNDVIYGPYGGDSKVIRTDLSLKEIEKIDGFAYDAKECYMNTLPLEKVWTNFINSWNSK